MVRGTRGEHGKGRASEGDVKGSDAWEKVRDGREGRMEGE